MAAAIGVSPRTIHRRLSEYGLSVRGSYTVVSDEDLDSVVEEINHHFPRHGYRNIEGHLEHRGIRVPRRRIRASLSRIDPEGVAPRWSYTIQRRTYNIRGPNCLWHIDGLHALIRWGMEVFQKFAIFTSIIFYLLYISIYIIYIIFIYCIFRLVSSTKRRTRRKKSRVPVESSILVEQYGILDISGVIYLYPTYAFSAFSMRSAFLMTGAFSIATLLKHSRTSILTPFSQQTRMHFSTRALHNYSHYCVHVAILHIWY